MHRQSLGESIRKAREALGLSQQSLFSMIGTSKFHLWKIETGRVGNPIDTLVRIADALDIKTGALIRF